MLLDVNCLLAIAWPNHQHHGLVCDWFEQQAPNGWRTCVVTELGFIRLSSNPAFTSEFVSPPAAVRLLDELRKFGAHSYLDAPSPCCFATMKHAVVQGHKQATDCYLIGLALSHDCRLATLDKRLRHLPSADEALVIVE